MAHLFWELHASNCITKMLTTSRMVMKHARHQQALTAKRDGTLKYCYSAVKRTMAVTESH